MSVANLVSRFSTPLGQSYFPSSALPPASEEIFRDSEQAKEKARAIAEGRITPPPAPRRSKKCRRRAGCDDGDRHADEHDMRWIGFLEHRYPGLSFSHIQRIVRKGELRVKLNVQTKYRLEQAKPYAFRRCVLRR